MATEVAGLEWAGGLWNEFGCYLHDVAGYVAAREAYERTLKIDEPFLPAGHPNIAIRVNNFGMLLRELDDLTGAQAAFELALVILERYLPAGHPNIEIVWGNIAALIKLSKE